MLNNLTHLILANAVTPLKPFSWQKTPQANVAPLDLIPTARTTRHSSHSPPLIPFSASEGPLALSLVNPLNDQMTSSGSFNTFMDEYFDIHLAELISQAHVVQEGYPPVWAEAALADHATSDVHEAQGSALDDIEPPNDSRGYEFSYERDSDSEPETEWTTEAVVGSAVGGVALLAGSAVVVGTTIHHSRGPASRQPPIDGSMEDVSSLEEFNFQGDPEPRLFVQPVSSARAYPPSDPPTRRFSWCNSSRQQSSMMMEDNGFSFE